MRGAATFQKVLVLKGNQRKPIKIWLGPLKKGHIKKSVFHMVRSLPTSLCAGPRVSVRSPLRPTPSAGHDAALQRGVAEDGLEVLAMAELASRKISKSSESHNKCSGHFQGKKKISWVSRHKPNASRACPLSFGSGPRTK